MQTNVLIVGGGVAGLTLSALMRGAGLDSLVIDPVPVPALRDVKPSGRTVALMNGSIRVLQATGVWDRVLPYAQSLDSMRIIDDGAESLASLQMEFHASEVGEACFGYNIPVGVLRAALAEICGPVQTGRLEDYVAGTCGAQATIEGREDVRAQLIVGADGRSSAVRRIAGIGARERNCGQSALSFLISHTKPHGAVSTEFHRPGGPFALVPLPDDTADATGVAHRSAVVWLEKSDDAADFLRLDKDSFAQAVQDRTKGLLGTVEVLTSPECWPLRTMISDRMTAPRTALIAEAVHTFSPIGAQGLNLSLRDVAGLAETLVDAARSGEDIGKQAILDRYARRRSADVTSRVWGVHNFNRMVGNDLSVLRGVRRTGLRVLEALPPLKKAAMLQGLAPSADAGRLVRGGRL